MNIYDIEICDISKYDIYNGKDIPPFTFFIDNDRLMISDISGKRRHLYDVKCDGIYPAVDLILTTDLNLKKGEMVKFPRTEFFDSDMIGVGEDGKVFIRIYLNKYLIDFGKDTSINNLLWQEVQDSAVSTFEEITKQIGEK